MAIGKSDYGEKRRMSEFSKLSDAELMKRFAWIAWELCVARNELTWRRDYIRDVIYEAIMRDHKDILEIIEPEDDLDLESHARKTG